MDKLTLVAGASTTLQVGDETFVLSPFRFSKQVAFHAWAKDRIRQEALSALGETAPASERTSMIRWCMTSENAAVHELMLSPIGLQRQIMMCLSHADGTPVTSEETDCVIDCIGVKELNTILGKISYPEDEQTPESRFREQVLDVGLEEANRILEDMMEEAKSANPPSVGKP